MNQARELTRLAAILSRLDSPYDGERAAAGLLASRTVRKLGLTWAELIGPGQLAAPDLPPAPMHWRDLIQLCQRRDASLTDWEAEFLASLAAGFSRISERQTMRLEQIADRLGIAR